MGSIYPVEARTSTANANGHHDPVDRLIDALTRGGYDPRPCGAGKWESRCPGHKGNRRNLSITEGTDGAVLIRCHHVDDGGHNCPAKAIVDALGLELKDLFVPLPGNGRPAKKDGKPERKAKGFDSPREAADFLARKMKAPPTGHWVYRDSEGAAYAAVYRFDTPEDKRYRPVSLDPATGLWRIGDPSRPWLPYRLPELADAPRVYVLEGEKCVELARSLGLTATTTAHGASSAHKTDLAALAGKDLVILPDLGTAGEGYVKSVLGLLDKLDPRPTARVLQLPGLVDDGDDLEQWIATRNGIPKEDLRTELERLADACPTDASPPEPPPAATAAEPGPEPDDDPYAGATDAELGILDATEITLENPVWLWPRRFLKGKINLVVGEGGGGKTTIAIMVGSVVTRGGEFPDGEPSGEPGRVLILAAEDGAGDTILPRFVAAGADLTFGKVKVLTAHVSIPKKNNRPAMVHPVCLQDLAYWRKVFESYRPTVLVIDPIPAYLGKGVNDHKNSDVQGALQAFVALANEFLVCVIAITHIGKSPDRKLIHKVLGSVAYTNVARVVHIIVSDPDDPGVRYLHREKCNLDEPVNALSYRLQSATFDRDGETYKTSRVEFDRDPVAINAEAMANPRRGAGNEPTRGPDPKRETAAAEWLHDFLEGRTGWTERKQVIHAAGEAGLIGKQNEVTSKWSNLTMLYRAKDRLVNLPAPRAGKRIDEEDMKADRDRYPRICWRLVASDAAF